MVKMDLPKQLSSEYQEYQKLYLNFNRTTSGQVNFVSASSGITYNTNEYPSDSDIYNHGQEGMMNLLYKNVLHVYLIDASYISTMNNKIDEIDQTISVIQNSSIDIYTVNVNYDNGVYSILSGIPAEVPAVMNIRFFAPINNGAGDLIKITDKQTVPIKTLNQETIKANMWKTGSVVDLIILSDMALLSGGGAAGSFEVSVTEPTDKEAIWFNPADGKQKYYKNDAWILCPSFWG